MVTVETPTFIKSDKYTDTTITIDPDSDEVRLVIDNEATDLSWHRPSDQIAFLLELSVMMEAAARVISEREARKAA